MSRDPKTALVAAKKPWRPPTRRGFVAMLGAAAAAIAVRSRVVELVTGESAATDDPPRSPWAGTTRWIGHC